MRRQPPMLERSNPRRDMMEHRDQDNSSSVRFLRFGGSGFCQGGAGESFGERDGVGDEDEDEAEGEELEAVCPDCVEFEVWASV